MSASREEMLIEADRRGLLKGEQKAQFDEAVKRGLIKAPSAAQYAPGTPEYKQAKAAELAGEQAKFSGKLTPNDMFVQLGLPPPPQRKNATPPLTLRWAKCTWAKSELPP